MAKAIIIEKPLGGWIITRDSAAVGVKASVEGKEGQYAYSVAISPFRLDGRLGHIAPGETYTASADTGSRINELPLNGVTDTSNAVSPNSWIILKNARIVRMEQSAQSIVGNYDIAVSPVTTANNDIAILKDTNNVEYVIATWEDSTNGDVMIMQTNGADQIKNWYSTKSGGGNYLVAAVPHRIAFGPVKNDVYISNGQYIATATIAGAMGAATVSKQALNLGSGWLASSLASYGNWIAILGHRATAVVGGLARSECRLWLWDGFSPDPNLIYDVPDNLSSAIYNANGVLHIFTNGRNNTTKIHYFTGSRVETLFESLNIPNPPLHGSVDFWENKLHFGTVGSGQGIYCLDGRALHFRNQVMDGTNTASDLGMVKNLMQVWLFVGATAGGASRVYKTNNGGYYFGTGTGTSSRCSFRTRLYDLPYRSRITKFIVEFSQFGSGASVKLELFKDYDTATDLLNKTLTQAALGTVASHSFDVSIDDVNAFYMNIVFNHTAVTNTAAIIRRIIVLYEPTTAY